MLKRLLIAGAALCALATAAEAATTLTSQPAQYKGPGGSYLPAGVTHVVGQIAGNGAACIIGIDANCLLPGTSSGGAGGAVTGAASSFVDGWNVTLGTEGDTAQTDPTQSASQMAIDKGILQVLNQLHTDNLSPASVTISDGAFATFGAKADNYVTDPTSTTATFMAIIKGLLYGLEQPATLAGGNIAAIVGTTGSAANNVYGVSTYSAAGGTGNALLTNSAVAIATGARSLYGWDCRNNVAADVYLQWFDVASGSVTLGTTVPKFATWLPANGGDKEYLGGEGKIAFATDLTLAATTTPTGSTAPATGVQCTISYK